MADAPTLGARAPPGMGVQVPPRTPCRPPPTCETQARQGVASSVGVSGVVEPSKGLAADRRRTLAHMRRSGTPADALGAGVGDHACMAYDDRAGWQAAAIAFLDEGARAGDRLLYTGHGTDDELVAALSALPGRDELLASGRLTLTRTADLYGPPETFDADVQSAAYARAGQDVKASGHRALRVAADMSPVVTDASALRRLVAYELAVDTVVAAEPLITLCGYDVHRIGTAGRAVIAAHPVRCGADVPPFSVACRDDRIMIGGAVDAFCVTEFGQAAHPPPPRV